MNPSRPLRVLHVIDSLGRVGGAEEQMLENLRRFNDLRLSHGILCLYELEEDDRSSEVPPGVEVNYVYRSGVKESSRPHMVRDMTRAIRQTQPDLIHCGLPNAALGSRIAGRRLGIPVVESLVNISHENIRTVDNPAVARWKLIAHRLLDRISMRSVVRFQALSQAVARSWIDTVGIPADRVVIIPRGVDMSRFESLNSQQARAELCDSLGLTHDTFLILNVGRQVPQKGQVYAVRAMAALLRDVPNSAFLSAGSRGPMSDRLKDEADQLGVSDRVFWLGVRSDIPALLGACDAFVFPSLYEGLGVSLLEAMAAGVPSVTTDIAPMTEVITDRESGLLVKPQHPEEIASALRELANDPELRTKLGGAARLHIETGYASSTTAAMIESVYRDVLGLPDPA